MSSERKTAIVLGLLETYGQERSGGAIALYVSALADLSVAEVERAAQQAIRESRFMPTPAELRTLAGKGAASLESRSIRAWAEAWDAVSRHGAYESVEFADAATSRAIAAMGGWPAFCHPTQEIEWHRKEFLETYRAMVGEPGEPTQLKGVHAANALGQRAPIRIGFSDDAPMLTSSDAPVADVALTHEEASRYVGEIRRRLVGDVATGETR